MKKLVQLRLNISKNGKCRTNVLYLALIGSRSFVETSLFSKALFPAQFRHFLFQSKEKMFPILQSLLCLLYGMKIPFFSICSPNSFPGRIIFEREEAWLLVQNTRGLETPRLKNANLPHHPRGRLGSFSCPGSGSSWRG